MFAKFSLFQKSSLLSRVKQMDLICLGHSQT